MRTLKNELEVSIKIVGNIKNDKKNGGQALGVTVNSKKLIRKGFEQPKQLNRINEENILKVHPITKLRNVYH